MKQLKPHEIPIEDRVYFDLHNRDGRMGKRLVEAILGIRSIVSWGCEKVFDRPCTKKKKTWPKDKEFGLLILNFGEDNPLDDDTIKNYKSMQSKWNGSVDEGVDGLGVGIIYWKENIYGLSFNHDGKWKHFDDFRRMTEYEIHNGEALGYPSQYVRERNPQIGPKILINSIVSLVGNDDANWRNSLLDICIHFFESVRNTQIQDKVEKAFTFDRDDYSWMDFAVDLDERSIVFVKNWRKMSDSLIICFNGGGWDANRYMDKIDINSTEECKSLLGVVKANESEDEQIPKQQRDDDEDRGGSSSTGEASKRSMGGKKGGDRGGVGGGGSSGGGGGKNKNVGEGKSSGRGKGKGGGGRRRGGNEDEKKRKDAPNCKVVDVAKPANTNTLILKECATSIPDVNHTTIKSESGEKGVCELVSDDAWLNGNFITTIQQCGAAIIKARKLSSPLFAASQACNHIRDQVFGTPEEHVHCFHDIISRVVQNGSYEISESIDKIQSLSWSKSMPFWYLTSSKLSDALELNALGEFSSEQIGDFCEAPSEEEWEKLCSRWKLADIVYQTSKRAYDIKRPTANLFLTHLQEIPAYLGQESTNSIVAFLDPRFRMNFVEFCLCDESRATFVIRNICKLNDGCTAQFDGKNYLLGNPEPNSESKFDEGTEKHAKETCVTMLGKLNVVHEYCQSMQYMYHKSQKTDLVHLVVYVEEPVLPWVEGFSVLQWWKDNCKMACDFLAIPTSVATSDEAYCIEPREPDGTLLSLKPELTNALEVH